MTNTGASPAAAFAGERIERFTLSEPRVSRLTPTLSTGSSGVSAAVELEGWATSSSVVAANYNNTRSNRSTIASPDSAVTDEELERIYRYLEGEAVVAERFTVCLPDAEVPGGNGSIKDAVTPKRFIDYLTGNGEGVGHGWAGRIDVTADGGGDCDDATPTGAPDSLCEPPHLSAAVSRPTATGGTLEVMRGDDGVVVINSAPNPEGGPVTVQVSLDGGADGPESSTEAVYQVRVDDAEWNVSADGGGNASPFIFETLISQVLVQPPGCPYPFPALLYVGRAESDGQLVYSGGWVIDDATLYEDAVTMLTAVDAAPVVGITLDEWDSDSDGDGLGDGIERAVSAGDTRRRIIARKRRGARLDTGSVGALVEDSVLSEGNKQGYDSFVRKKPGRKLETGGDHVVTHLTLDAPILHLVNAVGASNEVKFKAGAELSKGVN